MQVAASTDVGKQLGQTKQVYKTKQITKQVKSYTAHRHFRPSCLPAPVFVTVHILIKILLNKLSRPAYFLN